MLIRNGFSWIGCLVLACLMAGCGGAGPSGITIVPQDPPGGTAPPPPSPNPTPNPGPAPSPPLVWSTPKPLDHAFGVTVNYSVKPPQEWDLLASAGINLVRFDLQWAAVETRKGEYDFSNGQQNYDALAAALSARHIRVMFILDYGNPLYEGGRAPTSEEAQAAFAAFAGAAARHFAGRDVVWEIWNEPNLTQFWAQGPESPESPSSNYSSLCMKTAIAIRANDPSAYIAVGAVSTVFQPGLQFIDELGRSGIFRYVDALSVHPYRNTAPESAVDDYSSVRSILARYDAYSLPIIDSECGRSTGVAPDGSQLSEGEQAALLVRTRLADLIAEVGLTTWYTWTNSSSDPSNHDGNFGIIRQGSLDPKPGYIAASAMMRVLAGTRYSGLLNLSLGTTVRVARFEGQGKLVLSLWTVDGSTTQGIVPLEQGQWVQTDLFGNASPLAPNSSSLSLQIGPYPTYLSWSKS